MNIASLAGWHGLPLDVMILAWVGYQTLTVYVRNASEAAFCYAVGKLFASAKTDVRTLTHPVCGCVS